MPDLRCVDPTPSSPSGRGFAGSPVGLWISEARSAHRSSTQLIATSKCLPRALRVLGMMREQGVWSCFQQASNLAESGSDINLTISVMPTCVVSAAMMLQDANLSFHQLSWRLRGMSKAS